MNDIHELKRQGLSISQISALTGYSRPTIRKYRPASTIRTENTNKRNQFLA